MLLKAMLKRYVSSQEEPCSEIPERVLGFLQAHVAVCRKVGLRGVAFPIGYGAAVVEVEFDSGCCTARHKQAHNVVNVSPNDALWFRASSDGALRHLMNASMGEFFLVAR